MTPHGERWPPAPVCGFHFCSFTSVFSWEDPWSPRSLLILSHISGAPSENPRLGLQGTQPMWAAALTALAALERLSPTVTTCAQKGRKMPIAAGDE